jgi:DNA repair ATPase RecN
VEAQRLKEVEKKLTELHAEKLAAATATAAAAEKKAQTEAARITEHEAKAAKLGSECAELRAELEALGKNHHSSTGQGDLAMLCYAIPTYSLVMTYS